MEVGGDGVDAVALCAVAHGGVLEAEARGAALGILGVQVEVAQLASERQWKYY